MRLVNEEPGYSDSSNVLNDVAVAFYCFHTVNKYAWVGDEYYLTTGQIMVGDYR